MIVRSGIGHPVLLSSLLDVGTFPADLAFYSLAASQDELMRGALYFSLTDSPEVLASEVEAARRCGAAAVICKLGLGAEGLSYPMMPVIEVPNVRRLYAEAAEAIFDRPASKMKLIAIAGTSGKTSTSYIVAGMLAESGHPVGLVGSLGVYNGQKLLACRQTPPDAYELADLLHQMVENGCTHAIIEVSSRGVDEERIGGLKFDAVCLTNIRRDHLDIHKSVDTYRRAKMRIFDYAKPDAVVICNSDDRVTSAVLHLIQNPAMTIGMNPDTAMITGMRVEQSRAEQTFYIVAGSDAIPVRSKIIGNEHIYNCLTAAALGVSWGIDIKTVVRGIERIEHIPGRFERIDCGQPFSVFVDNADTPESFASILKTLRDVTEGTLYCVLSAPEDRDRSKRPLMGRLAESLSDVVIVTSNRDESDTDSMNDLLHGMETPSRNVQKIRRRCEAITWALSNASPEDAVVVVGSDIRPDADPEEVVTDRQFVRHWLYENQPCLEPYWF